MDENVHMVLSHLDVLKSNKLCPFPSSVSLL